MADDTQLDPVFTETADTAPVVHTEDAEPTEENTAPDAVTEKAPVSDAPAEEAPAEEAPSEVPAVVPSEEPVEAPAEDAHTDFTGSEVGTEVPADQSAEHPEHEEEAAASAPAGFAVENSPEGSNETAPLDPSAPSDASPASEETADKGDATAPSGDKGDGDTRDGTDTPEVMVSNPCDPVTGKPLSGQDGTTSQPIFGGGHGAPAASPSGQVIDFGGEDESFDDEEDEDEDDFSVSAEDGDEDEEEFCDDGSCDHEPDLESLSGLRGFAMAIKDQLEQLIEGLDGFED